MPAATAFWFMRFTHFRIIFRSSKHSHSSNGADSVADGDRFESMIPDLNAALTFAARKTLKERKQAGSRRSGLFSLNCELRQNYFLAAGLAFADFAGFFASVFFAAAGFFAAISVAPLGGLRAPDFQRSSLFGAQEAETTQKYYTPTWGVDSLG